MEVRNKIPFHEFLKSGYDISVYEVQNKDFALLLDSAIRSTILLQSIILSGLIVATTASTSAVIITSRSSCVSTGLASLGAGLVRIDFSLSELWKMP